jgi:hypothetical protein
MVYSTNSQLLIFFLIGSMVHARFTLSEAEFLHVIGTKVLRVFLLAIHSHLY